MKTLLLASAAVLTLSSLTGCAASGASDDDGGNFDADILGDANNNKHDGAVTTKDSGPASCDTVVCTSDQDCVNACGNPTNGVECCDTATSVCYAIAQTSCPAPSPTDAGFD